MYEIRRSPAARAAEQDMPESLSVAFGALLGGRGIILFRIDADCARPHVLVVRLTF